MKVFRRIDGRTTSSHLDVLLIGLGGHSSSGQEEIQLTSFGDEPASEVFVAQQNHHQRKLVSPSQPLPQSTSSDYALRRAWKDHSKKLEAAIEKIETRNLLDIATASRRDSKKFWNCVCTSFDKKPLPPISDSNGLLHYDDTKRAELLNSAFVCGMLPCTEHCVHQPAPLIGRARSAVETD
ncbi:hypothetical protein RvY_10616 [Ramazzottius varieornatus]|uniref:Uncharacterized protein n=1 Tax=Ramazzottius varieornatus TaxID=947166 RepID=A0A1D1VMC5_RAMVA|nr:hypothetical protein RvY_10616 [Ramazzottius varieornatus]